MNYPLGIGDEAHAAEAFENQAQKFDDRRNLFGSEQGVIT